MNGNSLSTRLAEYAEEARKRLSSMESHLATIAAASEVQEQMDRERVNDEGFSRIVARDADGANALTIEAAPKPGLTWMIQAIAVVTDTLANRAVLIGLGSDPSLRPLIIGNTDSANGGIFSMVNTAGLYLPAGLSISVRLPAAVPAATTCRLHIVGREMEGGAFPARLT